MSVPQPKDEAQPESAAAERQPGFSIDVPGPAQGEAEPLDLDAGPGSLPLSYGKNRLWSIARDPSSLYLYWELAFPIHRFPGARLAVAVHRADGAHEATAILDHAVGTRFLAVSSAGTLYHLTLGFLPPGKLERRDMLFVVAQVSVRTPRQIASVRVAEPDRGVLGACSGHSPDVLALLFPNLASGAAPAGGSSEMILPLGLGAHTGGPLPPERGGFQPPDS